MYIYSLLYSFTSALGLAFKESEKISLATRLYFTYEGSHSSVAVGIATVFGDKKALSPMFKLESSINTHVMYGFLMHRQVALIACPVNMCLDPNPSA